MYALPVEIQGPSPTYIGGPRLTCTRRQEPNLDFVMNIY